MTDIDAKHRHILTAFGVYQMRTNPGGIGNECTHWIYAALFEARALDHDLALHIDQPPGNLTWGRSVEASNVQIGDISQFRDFKTDYFIYRPVAGGASRASEGSRIRRPDHTGMIIIKTPRWGTFFELEAHLTQPGKALMSIRHNQIFYKSFSIAISTSDFARIKGSGFYWPANIDPLDIDSLLNGIAWDDLRDRFEIRAKEADKLIGMINSNQTPTLAGKEMAVVFRVQSTGRLRFYCPQKSDDRLRMSAGELAKEKARLIEGLKRTGRPGHQASKDASKDAYGGDNKQQRIKDHRFDWDFPNERTGSTPPPVVIKITP